MLIATPTPIELIEHHCFQCTCCWWRIDLTSRYADLFLSAFDRHTKLTIWEANFTSAPSTDNINCQPWQACYERAIVNTRPRPQIWLYIHVTHVAFLTVLVLQAETQYAIQACTSSFTITLISWPVQHWRTGNSVVNYIKAGWLSARPKASGSAVSSDTWETFQVHSAYCLTGSSPDQHPIHGNTTCS